jgi:hypothetical protein
LEPAVLDPCEMPDDTCNGQIGCGQQAPGRLLPLKVDESGRGDRSVLVEALYKRSTLVLRLEIRMLTFGFHHQLILAAPESTRRLLDGASLS